MEDQAVARQQTMLDEVLGGLRKPQKRIPSKFFYDRRGSRLFEEITELEEYYLTRTEISILETHIDEIARAIGSRAVLIELGSGSSRKTRLLLDRLPSLVSYHPVDISEQYLEEVARQLSVDYPDLSIQPICADYTSRFEIPDSPSDYREQVFFYPGSTIGNFRPGEAHDFLKNVAARADQEAALLVGVDLKKDRTILEAAYNDENGVTAEFNKNILVRLNRELDADFDPDKFRHNAFYNEEKGRIEMHLVSEHKQEVKIDGERILFHEGESIHTENSYKYSVEEFGDLVKDWFSVEQVWLDENRYFSLQYLVKR
ncbi:L-histidine N(alpha)-methyltransferase [Halalkalibaculum sp. DA384]|uniref:L-histidine N(alpha)-methyltransferase n=1 Tax=Halalkalibaculum sp. DA384 TaxID=3373606 RepID=UPI00375501CD